MRRQWMDPFGRYADTEGTEGMTSPVRCSRCGGIYDLGKVEVTARYADCSMWKAPCCGVTADDRKPPWGISWYSELPRSAPWWDSDEVNAAEEDVADEVYRREEQQQ